MIRNLRDPFVLKVDLCSINIKHHQGSVWYQNTLKGVIFCFFKWNSFLFPHFPVVSINCKCSAWVWILHSFNSTGPSSTLFLRNDTRKVVWSAGPLNAQETLQAPPPPGCRPCRSVPFDRQLNIFSNGLQVWTYFQSGLQPLLLMNNCVELEKCWSEVWTLYVQMWGRN